MSSTITQNLSQLVLQMSESATIKMAQMARDLAAEGHDVISLSLGEPDFDTPQHIKDAAIQALADGYTKYTPVPGLVELRKSIVTKFKRDNNLDFDISQIVVSNGAKQSIANLCLALLNKGDEVVILAPYWVSYSAIVKMVGATPIPVSGGIEKDFKVTGEQLKEAITENTKMVLFSSPCNPTGSVYTHDELKDLSEVISKHENITIVSDEIYEHINYGSKSVSFASLPGMYERTVTVNGISKAFAMTGWRIGYLAAPKFLAKEEYMAHAQLISPSSSLRIESGKRFLTLKLKDLENYISSRAKRGNMLPQGYRKVDNMIEEVESILAESEE